MPSARLDIDYSYVNTAIQAVNNLTRALNNVDGRTVTYYVRRVEQHASGGFAGARDYVKKQTGGLLPGYGGGDKISALLEAGEYVVNKKAVKQYGSDFMHALNNMTLDVNDFVSQARSKMPGSSNQTGSTEELVVRFQTDDMEAPVRVSDPSSKTAMKQFVRNLSKMRLSHAR